MVLGSKTPGEKTPPCPLARHGGYGLCAVRSTLLTRGTRRPAVGLGGGHSKDRKSAQGKALPTARQAPGGELNEGEIKTMDGATDGSTLLAEEPTWPTPRQRQPGGSAAEFSPGLFHGRNSANFLGARRALKGEESTTKLRTNKEDSTTKRRTDEEGEGHHESPKVAAAAAGVSCLSGVSTLGASGQKRSRNQRRQATAGETDEQDEGNAILKFQNRVTKEGARPRWSRKKTVIIEDEVELDRVLMGKSDQVCPPALKKVDPGAKRRLHEHLRVTKETRGQGKSIWIMMDSGAGQCVAAAKHFPAYEVEPSPGSIAKRNFMLADDRTIPNLGQMEVAMYTSEGQPVMMTTQVADVGEPIWSVRQLVQSGNTIVFRKKGGYISNKDTGLKTYFKERDGVYYIRMYVVGPEEAQNWRTGDVPGAQGFARRG